MLAILIPTIIVILGAVVELYIYFHGLGIHRPSAKFSLGTLNFWALGDRVLIREDEFRSGYECTQCGGTGHTACPNCSGAGENTGKKCSHCEGSGHTTCSTCNGKGGLLIAPEVTQRRPTSGTIVSAGHKCHTLKVGQSVLFSNFAGYVVDLAQSTDDKVTLRILHESEILCGMTGHLTLTNLRGKSEIAQYNP